MFPPFMGFIIRTRGCALFSNLHGFLTSFLVHQNSSIRFLGLHSLHQVKQRRHPKQVFINRQSRKVIKSEEKNDKDPTLYMRDTIRNIYNILRNSTWDSAQEQLENLSIRWDSYTINQVLKTHPPMEKAWLFFNWASRLKRFKHDQFTYTTMLDIFGEAGRISSMKYVLEQMQEKGIEIDAVTYTSLMHWTSSYGDVNGAMEIWEEMKAKKDCFLSVVSYTAYMKVLFDNNRIKEAIDVYKEMLQSGLSPTCHTYTILMEYLIGAGKYEEALEIFGKMQEAGVQPDKAACSILIEKFCKVNETEGMTRILKYMKENRFVLRYPIFLKALETLRTSGKSDSLLRQVHPHIPIKPDEVKTDSSATILPPFSLHIGLVMILLRKENLTALDHLLVAMINKNVKLDPIIVSTIIEVNCYRGRHDGALLAFNYCVNMGIIIQRNSYLDLIGTSIRTGLFTNVLVIVREMDKAGYSLGIYLASVLIFRLGKARRPSFALKLFDLLAEEEKCTATYTALIRAYFFAGSVDKGLKIYKSMKKKGLSPSLGTYNLLASGLEKSNQVSEADIYRKEMKEKKKKRSGSNSLEPFGVNSWQNVNFDERICDVLFGGDSIK